MDHIRRLYSNEASKKKAEQRWRFTLVKECLGIIAMAPGQAVENRALARAVSQDPRALRQMLSRFPQIRILMDPEGRRGLWYSINPECPKFEIPGNRPPPQNPICLDGKSDDKLVLIESE